MACCCRLVCCEDEILRAVGIQTAISMFSRYATPVERCYTFEQALNLLIAGAILGQLKIGSSQFGELTIVSQNIDDG